MFYKCLECGHIFEEGEQAKWEESRGEFFGSPCSETMTGCPICKGNYEEAKKCAICEDVFLDDELTSGVCEECLKECINNVEFCKKIVQETLQDDKSWLAERLVEFNG